MNKDLISKWNQPSERDAVDDLTVLESLFNWNILIVNLISLKYLTTFVNSNSKLKIRLHLLRFQYEFNLCNALIEIVSIQTDWTWLWSGCYENWIVILVRGLDDLFINRLFGSLVSGYSWGFRISKTNIDISTLLETCLIWYTYVLFILALTECK